MGTGTTLHQQRSLERWIPQVSKKGAGAPAPWAFRYWSCRNPTAVRVEVAGKVIAYTGDTEWTDDVAKVARGADLLIAESYFYKKPVRWHLNYPEIAAHRDGFGARRLILTHMSREMLAHVSEVPEECAYDGLLVTV